MYSIRWSPAIGRHWEQPEPGSGPQRDSGSDPQRDSALVRQELPDDYQMEAELRSHTSP